MKKLAVISITIALMLSVVLTGCGKKQAPASTSTRLTFTTQPGSAPAGTLLSVQPVVSVTDANGNVITQSKAPVTLVITVLSGTVGAKLSGTITVNAVNGIATFTDISIDKPGANYTLNAASTGISAGTSNYFNISGKPAKLSFQTDPKDGAAGVPLTTQPVVEVQDSFGSTVTDANIPVTLSITPRSGTAGASLIGKTTVNSVNGIATFKDIGVDKPGLNYTLLPASPGTNSPTSRAFNVSGDPASLVFSQQPIAATAATSFSISPEVQILDANGALVANSKVPVTVALSSSGIAAGLKLTGKLTVNAVDGTASFEDLSIDQPKTGCVLVASSPGLIGTQSNPFDVSKSTQTPTPTTPPIPTTPTTLPIPNTILPK